ncbi:MAG: DUF805 domain-containing protein [Microbacteriaceae bacterium]|jgi:uncharacterized membrane protein YhaH (DUF805 family)|nr:DUF805 domain-containing protein [Microbacteriaceae bacterium]
MSFGAAIASFFSKYATFSGRARRSEFWYAVLFTTLVSVAISTVFPGSVMFVNDVAIQQSSMPSNLWQLAIFVPSLALSWRRLHDVGRKGTYYLFILLPIVGWILLLVQFLKDSQPGANAFGEPVK